jgi:hypothetical protein
MKKNKILLMTLVVFCFCIQGIAGKISKPSVPAITIIDLDSKGYFNYHGKVSKMVQRGQKVIWICNAPFTIYFGNQSPLVLNPSTEPTWGKITKGIQSKPIEGKEVEKFTRGIVQFAYKASEKYHIVRAWISVNALSGKYKYIVAAVKDGKIWVDDPEDIVDPPRR